MAEKLEFILPVSSFSDDIFSNREVHWFSSNKFYIVMNSYI